MSTIQVRPPGRVRLTVEEFARIQDAGLFEGRHVQLLDGELYEVTKNPPHNFAVSALAGPTHDVGRHLRSLLPRDEYAVREEKVDRAFEGRGVAPCSRVMPLRGVSASQGSTLSPGGQRGPEGAATTQHRRGEPRLRGRPCPISSGMPRPGSRSTGSSTWPCASLRSTAIQGPPAIRWRR